MTNQINNINNNKSKKMADEYERKSKESIGHIVDHVTKSVEKQVLRQSSRKKKSIPFIGNNKQKYDKLDEQDQDMVIEAIRTIGESSLIFTSSDSPSSSPNFCRRKMGISETCEIQRKLVQKILKNYMITEHMKEYYFSQWCKPPTNWKIEKKEKTRALEKDIATWQWESTVLPVTNIEKETVAG